MDSIVQLIRNALCVCKDLQLFSSSFLYDNSIVQQYYKLQHPYNLTTPIEVLISIVQFYVVFSGVPASISLMYNSYKKIQQIKQLSIIEDTTFTTNKKNNPTYTITPCNRIIRISLYNEGNNASRSLYIGFNCFFISLSFIWLGCNSWHVTDTTIIGGIQGLIHALTVMNVCLTPLLYYMVKDHRMYFTKVEQMELTVQILKEQIGLPVVVSSSKTTSKKSTATTTQTETVPKSDPTKLLYDENNIDMIDFNILASSYNGWKPFWSNDTTIVATSATTAGTRDLLSTSTSAKMDIERNKVQDIIDVFCKGIDPTSTTATVSVTATSKSTNGNTAPVGTQARVLLVQETINDMEDNIEIVRFYGHRELLYFVINFIAWYGYGLCILVYYYRNIIIDERTTWENRIFLYMDNNAADYYGNLAGDCMWTIEPIIALFSPYYITELRQRAKTVREYRLLKKKTNMESDKTTSSNKTNTKTKTKKIQ